MECIGRDGMLSITTTGLFWPYGFLVGARKCFTSVRSALLVCTMGVHVEKAVLCMIVIALFSMPHTPW